MTNTGDRWLRRFAVLTLLTVATGCSEPSGSVSASSGEIVGSSSQALSATPDGPVENGLTTNSLVNNGFWTNGFWTNGFWTNGASSNGFWTNGFWTNGFWTNGVSDNGFWTNGFWTNGTSDNGFWTNGFWTNGGSSNGFWTNGFWTNGTSGNGFWTNGFWTNGTSGNGFWTNGFWTNGTSGNGFWTNGFWTNGFWTNGFWTNGLQADAIRTNPSTRQFLQYLYECAMPGDVDPDTGSPLWATSIVTGEGCGPSQECGPFSVCDVDHCVVPLKGAIGLGINESGDGWWETGGCDETCQRWISACLLARTNAYGVRIGISMRVPDSAHPRVKLALQVDDDLANPESEINAFPLREGAFYGNIFATTPVLPQPDLNNDGVPDDGQTAGPIEVAPRLHGCAGPGSNVPNITKRFCSSQGFDGPIDVTGECHGPNLEPPSVCEAITDPDLRAQHHCQACEGMDEPTKGALQSCHAGDGTVYNEVITVYIHDLAEKCGNAVCEHNEETVSKQCVAGEVGMDAPFCCPSDCHPGTWARSWDTQLAAAAADRKDGSVVIAGITSAPVQFPATETDPVQPVNPGDSAPNPADAHLVVAKYREDGKYLWSRRVPNTLGAVTLSAVTAAAIADDGTVVLAGTDATTRKGWVVKLDKGTDAAGQVTATAGNVLDGWPVTFGPTIPTSGRVSSLNRLIVDHAGNVVGAGTFANTIIIGSTTLTRSIGVFTFKVPSTGLPDMASAWAIEYGASSSNLSGLAVDSSNNVLATLITGSQSVLHKRDAATGAATLPGWTAPKSFPASRLTPGGVAADSDGAVYWTGSTLPVDLGCGMTHSVERSEFFLVKFGADDGLCKWDVGEAASNATRAYSAGLQLAFDGAQHVVVGGQFGPGTVDLGKGLFNAHKSDDIFVASYATTDDDLDEGARLSWAKHVPMILAGFFFGADVSESGRMYAAGQYSGSMMVDDRLLVTTLPENEGYYQTFLASFAFPGSGESPDIAAPEIHDLPEDMVVDAQGPDGTEVWYTPPTAIDGGYAGTNVSCVPPPNSLFPLNVPDGITPVTCTATDPLGHASAAQFTITVRDLRAPVIFDVPENQNVDTPSGSGAVVPFDLPFAQDLVDGDVDLTCDHDYLGEVYPVGTTTVTCTATDNAGNSSSASFDVVVALIDHTPPIVTVPGTLTFEATSPAGALVTYSVDAVDAVDGVVPALCIQASGTLFGLGTHTVACSAEDDEGNPAFASFQVIVRDTTAPLVTVPAPISVLAAGPTAVTFSVSASDAVTTPITPNCSHQSGSTFPLGITTVSCTAKDAANNQSLPKTFTVTVALAPDTTKPTLTLPSPITVAPTSVSGVVVKYTASATDNVDGKITPVCTPASGSKFGLGKKTVTCTAKDKAGNVAEGTFDVFVQYSWSGFLQPINADGSSIFKLGRTVPVKFKLTGGSKDIKNAVAKLTVAKISSNVVGTAVEAISTAAADSGNQFRYDCGEYIFNLTTKPLTTGTYQLSVDLGDGVARSVKISLR